MASNARCSVVVCVSYELVAKDDRGVSSYEKEQKMADVDCTAMNSGVVHIAQV
jgi:hypothetical protein